MGRGPAWAVVENMALIDAWLIEANNPIRETDRSGQEFWGRELKDGLHMLRNEKNAGVRAMRDKHGIDALRKQWTKVVAGVMEFQAEQSFHKKLSTPAGSIVPSTCHMCLFCDATLSILDRRSRNFLKRDQSTIPVDAQRSRRTLS